MVKIRFYVLSYTSTRRINSIRWNLLKSRFVVYVMLTYFVFVGRLGVSRSGTQIGVKRSRMTVIVPYCNTNVGPYLPSVYIAFVFASGPTTRLFGSVWFFPLNFYYGAPELFRPRSFVNCVSLLHRQRPAITVLCVVAYTRCYGVHRSNCQSHRP